MYQLGSFVEMKKPHACTIKATGKKANCWEVIRLGADIRGRCSGGGGVARRRREDAARKMIRG